MPAFPIYVYAKMPFSSKSPALTRGKRYDIGRLLFADDAAEIARRVKAQRQHEHRLTPAVLRHVVDERKGAVNVIRRVIISLFEHKVPEKIILIEAVEHFDFDVGLFFF